MLLKLPLARQILLGLNDLVSALSKATQAGTAFVFGYTGGGPTPFNVTNPAALTNFAFGVMPLVIVIFCSLPVPLSLAETCTIPFASISKVTSI